MSFAPSALLLLALLAQEPAAKKPSVFPAPGQTPAEQDPATPPVVTVDRAQVEAEYFAPQFLFEAGHDRNNKDEHHNADGDTEDRNNRDQAEEGALRAKVAQGEEKAEGFGHA